MPVPLSPSPKFAARPIVLPVQRRRALRVTANPPAPALRTAAPRDTLWFRIKRAVMDVLCNLPIPRLNVRTAPKKAPGELVAQLKPGDVLLRRTEGTSGNLFIPSWWKHAAVYTGDGYVVEATFDGVKKTPIDKFFAEGDHVMVVRAKGMSSTGQARAAAYAEAQVGKTYDFDVNFDDDARLICTELADQAVKASEGRSLVKRNLLNAIVSDAFMNPNFGLLYSSAPSRSTF